MKRTIDELYGLSSSNYDDDKCPICLDILKDTNLTITPCGHKFCFTCISEHSCNSNDCPICRANIQTNKVRKIMYNDIFNSATHTMNISSRKMIQLIEEIKHKFLILFADHRVESSPLKDDEEINDIREKIALSLCDDNDFNFKIYEFMMSKIINFSFKNYLNNGLLLKQILED
tara:strand:- start:129 stop:650 length:522 start_codon:yes stop_codon:yes gene_type:complete